MPAAESTRSMSVSSEPRRWKSPVFKQPRTQPLTIRPIPSSQSASACSFSPAASPLTATSMQSSPDVLRGRQTPPSSSSPTAFQLPESCLSPPISTFNSQHNYRSTITDTVETGKAPGLIRRFSQGARNRIRRRTSSNHISIRDRSSGPVMMRRRSNSKTADNSADDDVDSAVEPDFQDVPEDSEPCHGLGLEGLGLDLGSQGHRLARAEGGISPVVDDTLRAGTKLIKVTKKKQKHLTFVLDTENAKVYWNAANPSKSFYIDDIQEIRLAADAQISLEKFQIPSEYLSKCFAICYTDQRRNKGRQQKTIYLIAETRRNFDLWTSTLQEVSKHRHDLMAGLAGSWQDEKTLMAHWKCEMARLFADRPHTEAEEQMNLQNIESLCRSLYIYCSPNMLRAQFGRADTHSTGHLNYEQFKDFVRRLKERKDIRDIYRVLASPSDEGITLGSFLGFLKYSQGIEVNARIDSWTKVFHRYVRKSEPAAPEGATQCMNLNAFTAFLCSPSNKLYDLKTSEATFDRPLNEYFISSSHNTYLLGRQVGGESSVEPYIRALQRGCRCVEIDCWDGADGRPIVMHGRTMTSSVLFSDCISIISRYAFDASDYPLIISLEVHCNAMQQQRMVDIMLRDFDSVLLREPLKPGVYQLPSPEELRRRILIKVKAGSDPVQTLDAALSRPEINHINRSRSTSSPWSSTQHNSGVSSSTPSTSQLSSPSSTTPPDYQSSGQIVKASLTTTSFSSATEDSDTQVGRKGSIAAPDYRNVSQAPHKSKIISSLAGLAVYSRGIKFSNFTEPSSKQYNHVLSLAERRFEDLCRFPDQKAQLEKHNMRYLMRIYPSGIRIQSSNPDPLTFWRRGVQMVALNWQTYDLPMQMNDAMFAAGTDRLGYVLKPRELRESVSIQEEIDEPSIHGLGKIRKKVIRFSVDVISGQQLPRPPGMRPHETIDPYVEIELFTAEDRAKGVASGTGGHDTSARHGISGIGSPHRRRTRVVSANGFNPQFNESFGLSVETKYPALVFVRWTVWASHDPHYTAASSSSSLGNGVNSSFNSASSTGLNNGTSTPYSSATAATPLATFTAKLSSLRQGYRHIPLFDYSGDQFMFATLFCNIRKQDPITIEREDPVPEKDRERSTTRLKSVFKRTLSQKNAHRPMLKNVGVGSSTSDVGKSSTADTIGQGQRKNSVTSHPLISARSSVLYDSASSASTMISATPTTAVPLDRTPRAGDGGGRLNGI